MSVGAVSVCVDNHSRTSSELSSSSERSVPIRLLKWHHRIVIGAVQLLFKQVNPNPTLLSFDLKSETQKANQTNRKGEERNRTIFAAGGARSERRAPTVAPWSRTTKRRAMKTKRSDPSSVPTPANPSSNQKRASPKRRPRGTSAKRSARKARYSIDILSFFVWPLTIPLIRLTTFLIYFSSLTNSTYYNKQTKYIDWLKSFFSTTSLCRRLGRRLLLRSTLYWCRLIFASFFILSSMDLLISIPSFQYQYFIVWCVEANRLVSFIYRCASVLSVYFSGFWFEFRWRKKKRCRISWYFLSVFFIKHIFYTFDVILLSTESDWLIHRHISKRFFFNLNFQRIFGCSFK